MEDRKKLLKKVNRKKVLFLKQETSDVKFLEEPSPHIFIGNGGLVSGMCREVLSHLLSTPRGHELHQLYLPPGKDYAFASFTSSEAALLILDQMNGVCVQSAVETNTDLKQYLSPVLVNGPPLHLYLCFVEYIPPSIITSTSPPQHSLPPGMLHMAEFISPLEEATLLDYFSVHEQSSTPSLELPYSHEEESVTSHNVHSSEHMQGALLQSPRPPLQPPSSSLKHRHVKHYGYEFLYSSNNVDPDVPLPGGLPDICLPILKRMLNSGLIHEMPDQLTVNQYFPGAGQ